MVLCRLEELAAAWGVSLRTVQDEVARGRVRVSRCGRRGIRIPRDEFERLTGQARTQRKGQSAPTSSCGSAK